MAKDSELEQAVAALRREFAAALPERLEALRAALNTLKSEVTRETLHAFHFPAHALQGTAGAYEAEELVPHVACLATLARRWLNSGVVPDAERDAASRELDALGVAIEHYRRRVAYPFRS